MALHLHTSLCYLHEAPIILRSFNKPSSAAPASCTQPDLPPDCQTRDAHPAIHGVLEWVRQFDNTKIHNLRCSVSVGKQRFFLTEKLRFMQQQGLFVNWKTKIIYSPKNPNSTSPPKTDSELGGVQVQTLKSNCHVYGSHYSYR